MFKKSMKVYIMIHFGDDLEQQTLLRSCKAWLHLHSERHCWSWDCSCVHRTGTCFFAASSSSHTHLSFLWKSSTLDLQSLLKPPLPSLVSPPPMTLPHHFVHRVALYPLHHVQPTISSTQNLWNNHIHIHCCWLHRNLPPFPSPMVLPREMSCFRVVVAALRIEKRFI